MRIRFRFPPTGTLPEGEAICPYCGGKETVVHQTHVRKIKHHKINEAVVKRLHQIIYNVTEEALVESFKK